MWPFSSRTPPAPPRVSTDKVLPLHLFDAAPAQRITVARLLLRFDAALDPDTLHDSLFRLLDRPDWRRIGARIRLTANGKLEQHIPSRFDQDRVPFLWTYKVHDAPAAQYPAASGIPEPTTVPSVLGCPEDIELLMQGSGPSTRFSECISQDIPQLSLHVECFTDTTFVSLSWLHTLTDAMGMSYVLQAWQMVLEGREGEVPPLNDAETDLLDGAGRIPVERHNLSHCLMTPWQLALFGLNVLAARLWWGANETKVIYIPGPWLRSVREQAMEELKNDPSGKGVEFLSDNDIICALLSKLASGGPTSEHPVWIMQAANLRPRLQSVTFPAGVATVGNFTNVFVTDMPGRAVQTGSIGQIAAAIRRATDAHNSGDQMDAMVSMLRETLTSGHQRLLGTSNMQMILFSNWAKFRTYDLDFSGARRAHPERKPLTPLTPSLALPLVSMGDNFLALSACGMNGPDKTGGYWATEALTNKGWAEASAEIERFKQLV